MKILITGGAGYTGIPLCQALLDEGHQVTIVDSFMFGFTPILHLVKHPNLTVIKRDIRNQDSAYLADKDVIYHLAGLSGYPACEANPNAARLINIDATRRLIDSASPNQLLIYASTTSFYGQSRSECRETDRIVPVNLYGESKKEAEDIAMQRANSISLRWATVFGTSARMRNDLMVNDFVDKALRERTIVLYDPDSTRTFMHLSDLVSGYIFALHNSGQMKGGIFNMGSTRLNYTKRQIAENIQKQVPCEIIIAKTGDKDVRDFLVNFDKAKALGFDCKTSLADGIAELVKLYRFYTPNLYSAI